jgi:transposase
VKAVRKVSEVAKNAGVSVQTIYRILNRVKQADGKSLTDKKNGITVITDYGEKILIERLTGVKERINQEQGESSEIAFLREQNMSLQAELSKEREHNRQQSGQLATLAQQLTELTRNNQILLGAEQRRSSPSAFPIEEQQPEGPEGQAKKPGLFARLFGKS